MVNRPKIGTWNLRVRRRIGTTGFFPPVILDFDGALSADQF